MTQHRRLIGLDHIWQHLKDAQGRPLAKMHGLGMTDLGIMTRYPWFSVDSSRAAILAGLGSIVLPRINREGPDYTDMLQLMVSNQGRFHQMGKANSYYSLGRFMQRLIADYCASYGYSIEPSLGGRKLRAQTHVLRPEDPVSKSQFYFVDDIDANLTPANHNSPKVASHLSVNLSDNWFPRMVFNLRILDQFVDFWRDRGKTIRLYNVIVPGSLTPMSRGRWRRQSRPRDAWSAMPGNQTAVTGSSTS